MLVTDNKKVATLAVKLRDCGRKSKYVHDIVGYTARLNTVNAAIGLVQLKYLDEWNKKRRENAAIYNRMFSGTIVKPQKIEQNNVSIYHQYTITAPKRDILQAYLAKQGIGSGVFYPQPLHLQDCFKGLGYKKGDFPVAEEITESVLSLPIYQELTNEQIEHVGKTALDFYK